jgi:hypothetical protein
MRSVTAEPGSSIAGPQQRSLRRNYAALTFFMLSLTSIAVVAGSAWLLISYVIRFMQHPASDVDGWAKFILVFFLGTMAECWLASIGLCLTALAGRIGHLLLAGSRELKSRHILTIVLYHLAAAVRLDEPHMVLEFETLHELEQAHTLFKSLGIDRFNMERFESATASLGLTGGQIVQTLKDVQAYGSRRNKTPVIDVAMRFAVAIRHRGEVWPYIDEFERQGQALAEHGV